MKVSFHAITGKQHVPFLEKNLRGALCMFRTSLRELSFALVGERKMSQLHERFMGVRGPTDVLSFPLGTDRRGKVTDGEVVVCVPQARRQARRLGVPVQNELLLYCLHGMLHLSGFDDRTEAGFEEMHRMEDTILRRLGVGRTFRPRPARAGRPGIGGK